MILNGQGIPGIFKWEFELFNYLFVGTKTLLGNTSYLRQKQFDFNVKERF